MNQLFVTGGIVTYNNADIIAKCIQSLLDCTEQCKFQLYIYDNHSTDMTVSIIKEHFPDVIILESKENRGFGYGHNQIINQIVDSDFHAIINPDIYLTEDAISQIALYMYNHPEVIQLTPEIRNLDGSIQYLPKLDPNFKRVVLSKFKPFAHYRREYTREDENFTEPVPILSSTGCFSVIKTEVLKLLQGYDQRFFMYFEDADLSRRLREYGVIIYHPGISVYHEWKRDNTRSLRGILIFLTSMLKYYRKWR